MSGPAMIQPVSHVIVVQELVTSYIIRPEALVSFRPEAAPVGTYIARFDNGSVGDPAFAVLPYMDGRSAQSITLAEDGNVTNRSPRYLRTADRGDAVDYRLHMPVGFRGWTPPPAGGPLPA